MLSYISHDVCKDVKTFCLLQDSIGILLFGIFTFNSALFWMGSAVPFPVGKIAKTQSEGVCFLLIRHYIQCPQNCKSFERKCYEDS